MNICRGSNPSRVVRNRYDGRERGMEVEVYRPKRSSVGGTNRFGESWRGKIKGSIGARKRGRRKDDVVNRRRGREKEGCKRG